jgi:hypothetical protein
MAESACDFRKILTKAGGTIRSAYQPWRHFTNFLSQRVVQYCSSSIGVKYGRARYAEYDLILFEVCNCNCKVSVRVSTSVHNV